MSVLCLKFLTVRLVCTKHLDLLLFLEIEILFSIKQCPLKVMPGNKLWSTKGGAKLLLDLLILSIFSSDTPLDFHDSI